MRKTSIKPVFIEEVGLMWRGVAGVAGGAGGIRTLDRALQPYNGLANRRLQPLGHSSGKADMPDAGASRKRQISVRRIPRDLDGLYGHHATKSRDGGDDAPDRRSPMGGA